MMNVFLNIKHIKIKLVLLVCCSFQVSEANNHDPFVIYDCDLCGCSTGSGSAGFGTLDNLSFVGLRYIYQSFESRDGVFSNSPTSEEQFNTYQVWGRVPFNQSFYMNAIVPYQDLNRKFTDRSEHLSGLGDISVIGWYQLNIFKRNRQTHVDKTIDFNNTRELSGHKFNFGIGVKLPTGEFEEQLTNRINPGFQVGTGSLDGIFSIMHTYSRNKFGVNTAATYYLKSENKNDYQFGNQFSFASNAFYNVDFKKNALSPFLGISGDFYQNIKQFGEVLADTDGSILNGTIGSEFMMSKFIVGANYTFPLSQQLFGDNVTSKNRVTVYLNYIL